MIQNVHDKMSYKDLKQPKISFVVGIDFRSTTAYRHFMNIEYILSF